MYPCSLPQLSRKFAVGDPIHVLLEEVPWLVALPVVSPHTLLVSPPTEAWKAAYWRFCVLGLRAGISMTSFLCSHIERISVWGGTWHRAQPIHAHVHKLNPNAFETFQQFATTLDPLSRKLDLMWPLPSGDKMHRSLRRQKVADNSEPRKSVGKIKVLGRYRACLTISEFHPVNYGWTAS